MNVQSPLGKRDYPSSQTGWKTDEDRHELAQNRTEMPPDSLTERQMATRKTSAIEVWPQGALRSARRGAARSMPSSLGHLAHVVRRGPLDREPLDLLGDRHDLVQRDPAAVAGVGARAAADRLPQHVGPAEFASGQRARGELGVGRAVLAPCTSRTAAGPAAGPARSRPTSRPGTARCPSRSDG